MPEKVKELDKMLMAHLNNTTNLIPIPNPNYKPEAAKKK